MSYSGPEMEYNSNSAIPYGRHNAVFLMVLISEPIIKLHRFQIHNATGQR